MCVLHHLEYRAVPSAVIVHFVLERVIKEQHVAFGPRTRLFGQRELRACARRDHLPPPS